jgi:hypothetical protein
VSIITRTIDLQDKMNTNVPEETFEIRCLSLDQDFSKCCSLEDAAFEKEHRATPGKVCKHSQKLKFTV